MAAAPDLRSALITGHGGRPADGVSRPPPASAITFNGPSLSQVTFCYTVFGTDFLAFADKNAKVNLLRLPIMHICSVRYINGNKVEQGIGQSLSTNEQREEKIECRPTIGVVAGNISHPPSLIRLLRKVTRIV